MGNEVTTIIQEERPMKLGVVGGRVVICAVNQGMYTYHMYVFLIESTVVG